MSEESRQQGHPSGRPQRNVERGEEPPERSAGPDSSQTSTSRASRRAAASPYFVPPSSSSSSSMSSPSLSRPSSRCRGRSPDVPQTATTRRQSGTPISVFGNIGNRTTTLRILQQPQTGLEAGYALRILSRLPIAPPPILDLVVTEGGRQLQPADITDHFGFLVCSASLLAEDGVEVYDYVQQQASQSSSSGSEPRQALIGLLVSDLKQATIEDEARACFVFGDLSVRKAGRYRLKFVLAEAQPFASTLAEMISEIFEVTDQTTYVQAQGTSMTRELIDQGVLSSTTF